MNIKRATHIARHNLCVEAGISKAVPNRPTYKWLEFWKIIVTALEKQVAKKPNLWGDYYLYNWKCPECSKDYLVGDGKHNYCPNCGQKIDWEGIKSNGEDHSV